MNLGYKTKIISLYDEPLLYEKIISYRFFDEEIDLINKSVKQLCPSKKQYSLLDLGGGTGKTISLLSAKKYKSLLIDSSLNMCGYANEKYNVKSINADFLKLPLNSTFDVIICLFNTISYITDIYELQKFFVQIKNLLNDKGIFIFGLTYFINLEQPFDICEWSVLDDDYNDIYIKYYYSGPVDYENQTLIQNLIITDINKKTNYKICTKKIFLFPLNIRLIVDNIDGLVISSFLNGANYDNLLSKAYNVKSYYTVIQKNE